MIASASAECRRLPTASSSTLRNRLRMPMQVTGFLELAHELACFVAKAHARGVCHLDVNPSNIVVDASGQPSLINCELAPDDVANLTYIAPEQTGRMNRLVDQRSDLYSLGVVFYELLTGAPPFRGGSPVELVHAHLARVPVSPAVIAPQVPEVLANIVLKLLAKAPEARYQTADALAVDLENVRHQHEQSETVVPFELGTLDLTLLLPFPEKLFGRERELVDLRRAVARVTSGHTELVLVTGSAGVGKSALVRELAAEVSQRGGRFLDGKVDLRRANVPYAPVVEAAEKLVTELLAEPADARETWRAEILAAVGVNGRLLTDLLPHLTELIGAQPPVAVSDPVDAQARLHAVLRSFLGIFAATGHPVVMFLDDLQWADDATIEVLRSLAFDATSQHLLLIGAYRPSEVGPDHAVARLEANLQSTATPVRRIELSPLPREAVAQLLVDTLRVPAASVAALADLVARKTAGNPFFIRLLLRSLQRAGLLVFDVTVGMWSWDLGRIDHVTITDNVVDLLVATIARLPDAAREVLMVAACAGKLVERAVVAGVLEQPEAIVCLAVQDVVRDGLLVIDVQRKWRGGVAFRFAHDRIQQAAYSQLDGAARQELHLRIGRHLLAIAGADDDERLFDIADQLNLGAPRITTAHDRYALAVLNLRAANKARTSAAYGPALGYLTAGIELLSESAWCDEHALAFTLKRGAAECALLVGDHARSIAIVRESLARTTSRLERADLYSLLVISATVRAAWTDALAHGQEALRDLGFGEGVPVELGPGIEAEVHAVKTLMRGRAPEQLLDEPIARPEDEVILRLLVTLHHPAWFSDRQLFTYLCARTLRFILEHGHGPASLPTVTDWAMCLASTDQFDDADAYVRLAIALAHRLGSHEHESHATYIDAAFIKPWRHAYSAVMPQLRDSLARAVACGEVRIEAYARSAIVIYGWAAGRELDELLRDLEADLPFLEGTRYGSILRFHLAYRQAIRALKGLTHAHNRFDDDEFDETAYLESVRDEPSTRGIYEIRRLVTSYVLRDFSAAATHADDAARYSDFMGGYISSVELNLFSSLTFAALCDGVTPGRRDDLIERIRRNQSRLAGWVSNCPANFRHKHLLVEAELARIEGRHAEATELYDEASEAAANSHVLHEEAIARELAGRYALSRGRRRTAELHLREAWQCYSRWGAIQKVRGLEDEFPSVRLAMRPAAGTAESGLDLSSILRAVGSLATEVDLDGLLEQLLRECLSAAGAERAVVILEEHGCPFVRASTTAPASTSVERTPLDDARSVPGHLVNQVRVSRRALVIEDASHDVRTLERPYFDDHPTKSVLLVPVQRQATLVAVLYFENNLITHAFTPARITVLELLAAQVAGSLQNSLLVERLRAEILERTRAEQAVRFLARAGTMLAESLDHDTTLSHLAQLAIPALADWCVVDLFDLDGGMHRVSAAHADPAKLALLETLREADRASEEVVRLGEPMLLDGSTYDNQDAEVIRQLGTKAAVLVPLAARGRTIGAMTFGSDTPGRYGPAELSVASELARRAALAVDSARLFHDLEDAVRVRDEFMAIAAHELKTPLTSLTLAVEALLRTAPSPPERTLLIAERQVGRLSRLIDELMDVTRLQSHEMNLNVEQVDLTDVVRTTAESFGNELARTGSILSLSANTPVTGWWDRLRLEQVVGNLLSNAIKFGSGKPIDVAVAQLGNRAVLTVRDHGIGIPPDRIAHIFKRFERAVSVRSHGGLGLGLYIVRVIVTALGGEVSVQSKLGQGSTFTVVLPATPGSPCQETPPPPF